jgi:hypothetical protein
MPLLPLHRRDKVVESSHSVAKGWLAQGRTLRVALNLDKGIMQAAVDNGPWTIAIHGDCRPGSAVGAALFPALSGYYGAQLLCNWGQQKWKYSPPEEDYQGPYQVQVEQVLPTPSFGQFPCLLVNSLVSLSTFCRTFLATPIRRLPRPRHCCPSSFHCPQTSLAGHIQSRIIMDLSFSSCALASLYFS